MESDFLILDYEALKKAKALYQNKDATLIKSVDELVLSAEKELTKGPYSVTHKTTLPPSKDKHDYMSAGTYWWPDPNAEDGLPYIRRDGNMNPEIEGDAFDIKRLKEFDTGAGILAVAYFYTGNETYGRYGAKLIRTWFIDKETKMNPNLQFAQAIPGRCDGRDIGIIDTCRLIEVIDAALLLHYSNADLLNGGDMAALRQWFAEYTGWLLTSDNGKGEERQHNNHGVWFDAQVIAFSHFCGRGGEIAKRAKEMTVKRIDSQVEPDGRLPEELARTLSCTYSMFVLRAYTVIAVLAKRYGVDLWRYQSSKGGSLKLAFDFMLPYLSGEKEWEWEQIKPAEPHAFVPYLQMVYREFGDSAYESVIKKLREMGQSSINLRYPSI